jgi:hypothetical protein
MWRWKIIQCFSIIFNNNRISWGVKHISARKCGWKTFIPSSINEWNVKEQPKLIIMSLLFRLRLFSVWLIKNDGMREWKWRLNEDENTVASSHMWAWMELPFFLHLYFRFALGMKFKFHFPLFLISERANEFNFILKSASLRKIQSPLERNRNAQSRWWKKMKWTREREKVME